jgi:hypothetical protein
MCEVWKGLVRSRRIMAFWEDYENSWSYESYKDCDQYKGRRILYAKAVRSNSGY